MIGRLPVVLESDSIRVEVQTKSRTQYLTVFDVVYTQPSYTSTASYERGTELGTLNEQKAVLNARVAAIEGQKRVLEGYSDSLKEGRISGMTTERLEQFMDIYYTRQVKMYEEKCSLQKDIEVLDDSVKEILAKTSSEEEGERSTSVTVVVLAEESGPVELTLNYGKWPNPRASLMCE